MTLANIVASLLENTKSDVLRVVNVDDTYDELKIVLYSLVFKQINNQYEMILPLGSFGSPESIFGCGDEKVVKI